MKTRISAIIIDHLKDEHDYSSIKSEKLADNAETEFDITVYDSALNILKKINDNRGVDCIFTIGDLSPSEWGVLNAMPFLYRRKWCHSQDFNPNEIGRTIISVFLGNINRENPENNKLFSIFTCLFNTSEKQIYRLYSSLINQTFGNWNWFILDDGTSEDASILIQSLKDPRITIIKNITNHGSIGFNKHTIAMMCDGDYLVEVDHDDELTTDCLYYLNKAFSIYKDADFVYSDAIEDVNGQAVIYGNGWGWGEGTFEERNVEGRGLTRFSSSPQINPYTIRTIYAQPNHVRCWKKEFYHKIGGHNIELSVLDDMDILIRTFLYGKMCKIDKVLYIQYESEGERGVEGNNAQSKRFAEIQRTTFLLKSKYDRLIHERILEYGFKDDPWDEKLGYSILWKEHTPGQEIMSYLLKEEGD